MFDCLKLIVAIQKSMIECQHANSMALWIIASTANDSAMFDILA